MTVGSLPTAGQSAALVARYQSNSTMYYAGVFNIGGSYFAQIFKIVGGVTTMLNSASLSSFTGGTITFNLTGSTLQLIVGSTTVSKTDASIAAAGRVGIRTGAGTTVSSFTAAV
jgi:hypothetical protein